MRLIDADALKIDYYRVPTTTNMPVYYYVSKEQIDSAPTVDAIPLDWIEQRMNETADGLGLNFELNNALFIVSIEWERWKKEHATD